MTDTPIDSRILLNKSIPGQGLTNDPENPIRGKSLQSL